MNMTSVDAGSRKKQLLALAFSLSLLGGCMHPLRVRIDEYRAAKNAGDYATVAKYLAPDARIWFGKKEGEGNPLRAKGGPYAAWDKEFRSTSVKKDFRVKGRTLSYVSHEINDFYRLIERQPTPASITYYFDDEDRITGMLYRGLAPKNRRPPDRYCEFKVWAAKKYPGLLESDEMGIPNQPKRWRELLVEWRAEQGFEPID